MRLQLAIDRVSVEDALALIQETHEYMDIIEIGTSLIKDYGMQSIRTIRRMFPDITLLADIKTIDEAEYEFRAAYEAGADLATVMGAASLRSIEQCDKISKQYHKEYMIDLLEVSPDRLEMLTAFQDAIFAIHLPSDCKGHGLDLLLSQSMSSLRNVERIAIAGGVSKQTLPAIKQNGIEIAIIGSAITGSPNPRFTAMEFSKER